MQLTRRIFCIVILISFVFSVDAQERKYEQVAPLLSGMGNVEFKITTDDTLVQKFFNQGLALSYGFNHKEAYRSFKQAAVLDPDCAMTYWGQSLVLGPNINAAMDSNDNKEAYSKAQKALKLSENVRPEEKALIQALTTRYARKPLTDRTPLDELYAESMAQVARQFKDNMDVQALYAEALMDIHPWDYWEKDGNPQPWTPKILEVLEYVLEHAPRHPGANHFYIHAVEASDNPERALPSARRLEYLVPGAGHLVHMPSHVYIRTGDYHKGTLANERAVKADQSYVTQCRQQGIYPLAYVPHNYHFLWATATMEGRGQRSMKAAHKTAELVDTSVMREPGMGTLQHYWVIPLYNYVRFGKWDKVLAYPKPDRDLIYPRGVWHYARGMAFTAKDQLDNAEESLKALQEIVADSALMEITIWDINTTQELMKIAQRVLRGEIYAKRGQYDLAIGVLRAAVEIEDQLNYNEPPDWFFPVRHSLGAVLLESGKPVEAESVYRRDLKKFPNNGWALYGLYRSLIAQDEQEEARKIKSAFEEAWQYADTELTASRIM